VPNRRLPKTKKALVIKYNWLGVHIGYSFQIVFNLLADILLPFSLFADTPQIGTHLVVLTKPQTIST
jgi:hypothetical protein